MSRRHYSGAISILPPLSLSTNASLSVIILVVGSGALSLRGRRDVLPSELLKLRLPGKLGGAPLVLAASV